MLNQEYLPVLKLPIQFDIDRLNKVFEKQGVFDRFGESGTISLMHRLGVEDPWSDGVTNAVLKPEQPLYFSEADFTQFNPGLEGTYFNMCYNILSGQFKGKIGRIRIFKRDPQTSSSLHQDLDVRFHLSLQTNSSSFLVFPELGIFQIPADGHVYLVDTTRPHFAVNASSTYSRIHLVCSTYSGVFEHRDNQDQIISAQRCFFSQIAKSIL